MEVTLKAPVVVSMKYVVVFLLALSINDDSSFNGDVGSVENLFWYEASKFDDALLVSKQASKSQLEKLKNLSLKIDKNIITEEFYIKSYEFIRSYGNDEVMFEFLKENLDEFSPGHSYYLKLIHDFVISSNNIGQIEFSLKYLEILKDSEDDNFKIYYRLIKFEIDSDERSLLDLFNICRSMCEFDYYYLALLDYYYSFSHYGELKSLSDKILNDLISNDFSPSGRAFPQYVFAYLSVIASMECELDVFKYLSKNALEGIPFDARDYEIIANILPDYDDFCKANGVSKLIGSDQWGQSH